MTYSKDNKKGKDKIYQQPLHEVVDFSFDESVVQVFPDMISRSVPGYATIINMIGRLAERYITTGTVGYDLGCSLGAATLSMLKGISVAEYELVAVDNSAAMIDQLRPVLENEPGGSRVNLRCEDLQAIEIKNASMVVLNFTLQFIDVEAREEIISTIYEGMNPGGVLVLSEKLAFPDPHLHDLFIDMHHSFKRANGYSELEIAQKRTALENVLIPETLEAHKQRLSSAGFASVDVWFQCFNFASLIAIK